MEGLAGVDRVNIVLPGVIGLEDVLPLLEYEAFAEIERLSEWDKDRAFEHCMKVIETMIKEPANGHSKVASMLLGRKSDTYLSLPPEALREVFPVLFYEILKDSGKAMKFLRTYSLLHNAGIICDVTTSFKELQEDIKRFPPAAMGALKLFQYHDWFTGLPEEERRRMILHKDIIKQTLVDVMDPILAELEKQGKESRIIIYGPNDMARYRGYDSFRAIVERQIFERLQKKYGKHPQIELRTDKSMNNAVEMLKRACYSN